MKDCQVMSNGRMKKIVELLKKHEGVRLRPYLCSAGKVTIGVGRNIEDIGISDEESDFLLMNDIKRTIRELCENVNFFDTMDGVRKVALVDMCFNLGISRFLKFKKTLKFLSEKNYPAAADEMLNSRWARQVGPRAKRLSKMIETGNY